MSAQDKKLAIKSAIYQMGLRFNQEPSREKIEAYANDLIGFTPEQIIFAFRQVINSGSAFFPSLAEILKHLRPPEEKKEDLAPVIVNEMLQAIRNFSQYDEVRMLESVSENARLAFLALGSTMDIRLSENLETSKAQLRDLIKGVIASKENAAKSENLARIGIMPSNVIPISDKNNQMRGLSFSEFSPEPA